MLNPINPNANERARFRGLKQGSIRQLEVFCGNSQQVSVKSGEMVSITNLDGSPTIYLTALLEDDAAFTTKPFDIPCSNINTVSGLNFDFRKMQEIAISRDSSLQDGKAIRVFDDEHWKCISGKNCFVALDASSMQYCCQTCVLWR